MNGIQTTLQKIRFMLLGESKPLANSPRDFTLKDWKIAIIATKEALGGKRIGLLAAGIAYFATLAFFPLLAASVAIASFAISEDNLNTVVKSLEIYLPSDIASLVTTQLAAALQNESASTIVAIVAIIISLFSVSGATQNLISAGNVSYEVEETRNFIKLRLTSIGILLANLVAGSLVVVLLLMNRPFLQGIGIPDSIAMAISILRWVGVAAVISISLAIFYRYGPNKSNPKWQWVSWGSVIAAIIWLIGTALFFVYARYFANFSESYSLFAGIIVLMTWFNLTSFIVLLGAEVNHKLEHLTLRKTSK